VCVSVSVDDLPGGGTLGRVLYNRDSLLTNNTTSPNIAQYGIL